MPYLSDGTTVLSNLSLTGDVKTSTLSTSGITAATVQVSALTATSRITTPIVHVSGGAILSAGSADFRTNTVVLSIDTRANTSGMTTGQLRVVFAASGMSLMYSSGATVYTIGASAVSAAQA